MHATADGNARRYANSETTAWEGCPASADGCAECDSGPASSGWGRWRRLVAGCLIVILLTAGRGRTQAGSALEQSLVLTALEVAVDPERDVTAVRGAEDLLCAYRGAATPWLCASIGVRPEEVRLRLLKIVGSRHVVQGLVLECRDGLSERACRAILEVVECLVIRCMDLPLDIDGLLLDLARRRPPLVPDIAACLIADRCVREPLESRIEKLPSCSQGDLVATCLRLESTAQHGAVLNRVRALALKQLRALDPSGARALGRVRLGDGWEVGGPRLQDRVPNSISRAIAALDPESPDAVSGLRSQLREPDYRLRAKAVDYLGGLARRRLLGAQEAVVVTDLCETVRLGGTTARGAVVALGCVDLHRWSREVMETLDRAFGSGDIALREASDRVRRSIAAGTGGRE